MTTATPAEAAATALTALTALTAVTARIRCAGTGSRTPDAGSVTLWLLGMCVMLLVAGGLTLDLWRGYAERRALANLADAAAVAAAGGLDTARFRATGEVALDPQAARALARAHVLAREAPRSLTGIGVHATPESVTVTVTGELPLTLLRLAAPSQRAWRIDAAATARPHARR